MWRAVVEVLRRMPWWLWAPVMIAFVVLTAHLWTTRQTAQIDAQGARAALDRERAQVATERAVAAESAAQAVTGALRAQQDHAQTQQGVLDELAEKKRAAAEWARAYADVVRGRAVDSAGADRLRQQLRAALDAASRPATGPSDAAAGECLRAAGELGDLLAEGRGLVVEGAGLVVEGRGLAAGFELGLDAAERVIANDRALSQ